MSHDHEAQKTRPGFWRSRYAIGLIVIGAVAGYFLLTEHLAHVVGALPYLLLLACPLMHVFMRHGNGGHGPRHGNHGAEVGPGKPDQPKQEEPS